MKGLQRGVGLLIIGTAFAGAGLLWWSVSGAGGASADAPSEGLFFGFWHVLYDADAPSLATLAAAVGLALLLAAGVALLEQRIANAARRSDDRTPAAGTQGRDGRDPRRLRGPGHPHRAPACAQ